MKIRVLFVCLGNICRSPLAEAVFNKVIEEEEINDSFSADSCGTASYHLGKLPDQRTLDTGLKFGLKFDHVARALTVEDFDNFDYMVAMDKANFDDIHHLKISENNASESNIVLMCDFDNHGIGEDIPDPYYGEIEGFHHVYHILSRSIRQFINHLKKRHSIG